MIRLLRKISGRFISPKSTGFQKRKAAVRLKPLKNRKFKKNKIRKRSSRKSEYRYKLNFDFEFFHELRNLVLKASPAEKDKLIERIIGLGRVKLAVISGIFLSGPATSSIYDSPADLFIVGDDIDKKKLRSFLGSLEAEVGKEIKFTLMDKDEFEYRYDMFDRFVRVLLEGPHDKIINKLGL